MSNVTAAFIEKHHPKVKELMLQRQVEQGNPRDWVVFERELVMDVDGGGFGWAHTPELDAWAKAFAFGNFAPLYALHPEWSEPTEPNSLDLETMLNDIHENRPFYKDSGLWQVRTDDMEDVIFQQGANEPFLDFIKRVYYNQELLNENAPSIHPEPIKKPI